MNFNSLEGRLRAPVRNQENGIAGHRSLLFPIPFWSGVSVQFMRLPTEPAFNLRASDVMQSTPDKSFAALHGSAAVTHLKSMKKKLAMLLVASGLALCTANVAQAAVTVTSPTGGNNISADKALNSTNGAAFTALGNIVITEGVNTDFADGTNVTLILTLPSGWWFNAGVGTVSFTSGRNISAASILVEINTATVTFTVSGTAALDTLTIGGLQVQSLDGANLQNADYIRRLFVNPGTAVIAGIELDNTTFGLVNQIV